MRIRTIKPSFWAHPVMARQTDTVRLLAIGLLNLADDDGYFLAHPNLIRSALWPFDDDSTNVQRALDTLSDKGYVCVKKHPEQGEIGLVVKFREHQRIDRPSPSTLKAYFLDEHSTNVRGSFAAGKEGKGREGNEEGNGTDKRFAPPSREEVVLQCAKIGLPTNEGDKFLAYYEANGWRVGRNPMRKWSAALTHWKTNWIDRNGHHTTPRLPGADPDWGQPKG